MDEAARLLTLLALVGGALTMVGAAFAYYLDETRRLRRTLSEALGAVPQPMLTVRGRGVGVGFDLTRDLVAVAWDRGGWRLNYHLDELAGVELVVDRHVAARVFRGEARRGLDQLAEPQEQVRLRFVFDDAAYPEFVVDLWRPQDEGRRDRLSADEALQEANRWMARLESMLRRPARRTAPAVASAPAAAAAGPLFDLEDEDDEEDEEVLNDPESALN